MCIVLSIYIALCVEAYKISECVCVYLVYTHHHHIATIDVYYKDIVLYQAINKYILFSICLQ